MFNFFKRGNDTIQNPSILICVVGAAPNFEQDKAIYEPYSTVAEFKAKDLSDLETFLVGKTFDIVHLFMDFASDGTVEGQAGVKVFQLLTKADAKLVLLASDNSMDNYMAAFPVNQTKGIDNFHLVMTLDRKDDNFFDFFKSVFVLMAQGKSLPMAWVTIAPQHDGPWMEKLPDTVFAAKRGQLKFVP